MLQHDETITLTRTELYQRVWSTPVARLAREFGISDVALAKLCRRRNIPRPPRGYWARQAAGHTLQPAPLPPPLPQHDWPVVFRHRPEPPEPEPPKPLVIEPRPRKNGADALHPIADRVRKSLLLLKPESCGRVHLEQSGVPLIIASPQQATAIAQLVDALIEEAQRKQIAVSIPESGAKPLEFRRGKNSAQIFIEEELRASPLPQAGRAPTPSGQLTLRLALQWKQMADIPLESMIESLLTRMDDLLR